MTMRGTGQARQLDGACPAIHQWANPSKSFVSLQDHPKGSGHFVSKVLGSRLPEVPFATLRPHFGVLAGWKWLRIEAPSNHRQLHSGQFHGFRRIAWHRFRADA
jgi:hypothetical protein